MPKFNSREEYEKWKAQRIEQNKARLKKADGSEAPLALSREEESDTAWEARLALYAPPEKEKVPAGKTFLELLPGMLVYPFHGNGKLVLVGGLVFFSVLNLLGFLFRSFVSVFVAGYLSAYMMKIVSSSADGELELPDWPDFTDILDDILCPAVKVIGTLLLCFVPAFAYLYTHGWKPDLFLWGLVILGSGYYPMALLAVSQTGSFASINPLVLIPSMLRVFVDYLLACVVFVLIIVLKAVFGKYLALPVPIIGSLIEDFLALYFLIIEMRILGLLYYTNRERLNWFDEAEEY